MRRGSQDSNLEPRFWRPRLTTSATAPCEDVAAASDGMHCSSDLVRLGERMFDMRALATVDRSHQVALARGRRQRLRDRAAHRHPPGTVRTGVAGGPQTVATRRLRSMRRLRSVPRPGGLDARPTRTSSAYISATAACGDRRARHLLLASLRRPVPGIIVKCGAGHRGDPCRGITYARYLPSENARPTHRVLARVAAVSSRSMDRA